MPLIDTIISAFFRLWTIRLENNASVIGVVNFMDDDDITVSVQMISLISDSDDELPIANSASSRRTLHYRCPCVLSPALDFSQNRRPPYVGRKPSSAIAEPQIAYDFVWLLRRLQLRWVYGHTQNQQESAAAVAGGDTPSHFSSRKDTFLLRIHGLIVGR